MNLLTRDFGEVEIQDEDILTFRQPIYGFEYLSKFVLLSNPNISEHFVWLQSAEEQDICFILASPQVIEGGYEPEIPHAVQQALGEGEYSLWLIVVVAERFEESTANLKSPIIINLEGKCAAQAILEEDRPIRFPLLQQERED